MKKGAFFGSEGLVSGRLAQSSLHALGIPSVSERMTEPSRVWSKMNHNRFQAVILDMDGVITKTAKVHARAWKDTFDEFLRKYGEHEESGGAPGAAAQQPFDIDQDYRRYVDGKPRYEGVRSFLESRGIELPQGNPEDPADRSTVCGLGNRKNEMFQRLLESDGVELWEDASEQIPRWKRSGLPVAVFSSSRNCQRVLEAAGIDDWFDARVDGNDLEKFDMAGKPAPDMLIRAAKQLNVEPSQAVVIEDAIAGVQAGRAGEFGLVVGIARDRDPDELYQAGADRVIGELSEIADLSNASPPREADRAIGKILEAISGKPFALFLDYDGTLTPIVRRPEDATLKPAMRDLLRRLADCCTLAIVSGRDRRDVEQMVGLDKLVYAGSHGFDIRGPGGMEMQQEEASRVLPQLDKAEQSLREKTDGIEGAHVERKRFAIAMHYREVEQEEAIARVERAVDEVAAGFEGLRKRGGKKIFELQPDVPWDKGHAVKWLIRALDIRDEVVVIYIGDDVTDEDAFRFLRSRDEGLSIRVADTDEATEADARLPDCAAVQQLLESLADRVCEV